MSRRGVLVVVALTLVVASACKVRTDVTVAVNKDGSGTVSVAVGVDDDGLAKAPEFAHVRTDDLAAAGWTVTGPLKESDGLTWYRGSKPFANPEEATRILNEISGPNGPFRNFVVSRERAFAKTTYGFDGTIDLSGGLASFSDSALAAQLDGKPLGDDVAAIEQRIGEPLDNVFVFRVAVRLPGSVSSNAPAQFANAAVWQPRMSDTAPLTLHATSTAMRWPTVIGSVLVALAALGLVIWLVVRMRRRPTANVGSKPGL